VIERLAFRAPKTAQLASLLGSLGLDGRKALVLTAGHNPNAYLSGRNLPTVEVMAYPEASAYDILWSEAVVVEEGALTGVMPEPLAEETEAERAETAGRADQSLWRLSPPFPPVLLFLCILLLNLSILDTPLFHFQTLLSICNRCFQLISFADMLCQVYYSLILSSHRANNVCRVANVLHD